MPNLTLIRPADGAEVAMAWKVALEKDDGPTAIALTRQKVKAIDRTRYASAEGLMRGAYVLAESGRDLELILIATGSEVWVALEAFEQLAQDGVGVRLVSMPSWELFDIQPQAYREQVLPEAVQARVSVEAGTPLGWERWVGRHGEIIGLDHFGKSAEGELVLANFGFNPDNVVERARSLMEGTK